ncbi:hypothetical protein LIS77_00395 [Cytobacillus firmus]|nr:hypothetical protein [Cytobacillus firmus]USK39100.1 hypothetical protein LIS77_00395 [Cytobacillus firmus]
MELTEVQLSSDKKSKQTVGITAFCEKRSMEEIDEEAREIYDIFLLISY